MPRWRPSSSTAAVDEGVVVEIVDRQSVAAERDAQHLVAGRASGAHFCEPNDTAVTRRWTGLGTR